MTPHDEGWVAGLLEGEACFDFNRAPKYPRIRVEMTDKDVIYRLQMLVGGRVSLPGRRSNVWKQSYLLTINGQAAVDLMRWVKPMMGERRQEKIESLLAASCQKVT